MEEKLSSSVTRRPLDNFDYLPIKKRRHLLRSPSPTPQTSIDGICAPHDSVSDPKPMASDSLVELPKSQGIGNALVNTDLPHTEDSVGIEHLTDAVCKNSNVNDTHNVKVGGNDDTLLKYQGTDTCMDMPSVEKTTACIEGEILFPKDSVCGAHSDSPDQIDSTTVSSNILDKTENDAEMYSSSANDVRLHWDLNTVMDEWGLPVDSQYIGSTENGTKNISSEGLHSVVSNELHNSAGFKDLENVSKLLECISDINGLTQPVRKSKHLDSRSFSKGRINTSTKFTMLGRERFCTSSMQLGQTLSLQNVKLEKQDDFLVAPIISNRSTCEMVHVKSEKEHIKSYDVPIVGNLVSTCTTLPPGAEISSSKSEKAVLPNFVRDNVIFSPPVDKCKPVLDYVKKENDISPLPNVPPLGNLLSDVEMKELVPKSSEQLGPPNVVNLVNPSPYVETNELLPKSYEQLGPPKVVTLVNPLLYAEKKELMPKSYEQSGPSNVVTLVNHSSDVGKKELVPKSYEQLDPSKVVALANASSDVETKVLMPKSYEQLGPSKVVTLANHSSDVATKVLMPKSYERLDPSNVVTLVDPPSDVETKELMPKSYEQLGPSKVVTLANHSSDVETKELMPKSYERLDPSNVVTLVDPPSDVETKELMPKSYELLGPPNVFTWANPSSDVETKELMPKSYERLGPSNVVTLVDPPSDVETKELMPKSYELLGPPKVVIWANPSSDVETKELMPRSYEQFGEVALEEPFDDRDVSDLSLGGLGKVTKYPGGYESPFEDGELRERIALSWEENECETECLDYDIDDRDAYDFATGNHCMSEAGSESIQNEDNVNLTEKGTCGSANSLKESSNSTSVENVPGQDEIAMALEANNGKTDEMVVSDSIRRLDAKGSSNEEIRSREILSPHVGESPASGAFNEKDTLYTQQGRSSSRFQAGQVFPYDKYLGKDRRVPHMQDEKHKNNWNGSPSSFSRNHFQNNYRRGGIIPLPRSNIPNSETDSEGLAYRDQRRSTNYSQKGVYQPLVRRRPLDNSDNACSSHRENNESRDDGNGMIRGRSGIYIRGGFRNPSFSRPCRRSRSRSRSRTRSPIPWRMQEERNRGPRMERTRVHYDDPKLEENNDAFCSLPRKRYSSQGNSGFFNERNDGPSRGRFIGQHQRFDSRVSGERMKSDDGFRPDVSFLKPSGEVCRGNSYDKNNDNERSKYSDRNEMIRRGRHNDNGGSIRRFRNDAEDCFDGRNNRNDRSWEGRGPFKYVRERK